ncbi:hypothetical protein JCM10207_001532 [Rhodosporidiobolus poonsookiae]
MSGRSGLKRKAAQAPKYTFDAGSDEEQEQDEAREMSEEEEAKETKRGNKKRAPKRRKVEEESESEEGESSDDEEMDDDEDEQDEQEVEYDIPRVDFSKVLPFELVAEILSYLHPSTLYALSTLSKGFHAFFVGPNARSTWLKAFEMDSLPKLGGEEVDPRKLAALIFDKECEYCNERTVDNGDRYLLCRLCNKCREANWVTPKEIGSGKEYDQFHPAVLQCAISTPLSASDPHYSRSRTFYFLPALRAMDEMLQLLQIEDDQDADKLVEGPDIGEVHRNLSKAKRLKRRSWMASRIAQADEMEEKLTDQWTDRVKEFVQERKVACEERQKFAAWIDNNTEPFRYRSRLFETDVEAQVFEGHVRAGRREAMFAKIENDGLFSTSDLGYTFRRHDLVDKPEPFTDAIWEQIKEPLYANILGKEVAASVFSQKRNKKNRASVLKKPKGRSQKQWNYILPHLERLYKKHKIRTQKLRQEADVEKVRLTKDTFFVDKWEKLFRMSPTKDAGAYFPRYGTFLTLPSVKELYDDKNFGMNGAEHDADVKKWSDSLDAVLEETHAFAVDLKLDALKLILSVMTDMSADDLDALDADTLNDEAYGDDFFLRPSSWVCCSACGMLNPLTATLAHFRTAHPLHRLRKDDEPDVPFELPLEVAVAWCTVLELAGIDENDPTVTKQKVTDALEEKKLVWKNGPSGSGGRCDWTDLLAKVRSKGKEAEKRGEVLGVPDIVAKKLNWRERHRKSWPRGAYGRW